MLHTVIQKNNYQDSIVLMLLTNRLLTLDGVNNASVMMGTPANKDIFKTGGLYTEEMASATSNDMVLVLDIENETLIETVMNEIDSFIADQGKQADSGNTEIVKTWDRALELGEKAGVAVLSIPGTLAASEIERGLSAGKHIFCFSDNVSLEDEVRLKKLAHEKGLLLMGPDCGTGIINGIPVAFTNAVREGKIGVVGASGTGIQEVTTIIHKLGEGVTQAIGTGGRDLKEAVGGITMKDSIVVLENDPDTKVIVVISKPPAPNVRDEVLDLLRLGTKPAVTIFLGEKPADHEENLYRAYTLEEAAQLAVQLLRQEPMHSFLEEETKPIFSAKQQKIKGYYSGGTLAYEAAMLLKAGLKLTEESAYEEGYILKVDGHEIIDLGDDIYTQGKPHPMIDPTKRIEMMEHAGEDPETAIILIDVVLGYGSHSDMASELAPTIKKLKANAKKEGRKLEVIATIVGTELDPQNIQEQESILSEAGVILCQSNTQAVKKALAMLGHPLPAISRQILPKKETKNLRELPEISQNSQALLANEGFINIGLRSFAEAIQEHHGKVIQYDWQPVAGGNITLQKALRFLEQVTLIEK
ncbi:acyl-CoA synthetase FdrA [Enterococcus sp.]|uniref:acyl-CoA synthetase FdrA n=1 Tax=Enterococcus sp. TaxID=35783 RepID=UPI0025BB4538|nr:acyl-CoA synthetase FdrA [Enterococcus sp.]